MVSVIVPYVCIYSICGFTPKICCSYFWWLVGVLCIWCWVLALVVLCILMSNLVISLNKCCFCCIYYSVSEVSFMFCIQFCVKRVCCDFSQFFVSECEGDPFFERELLLLKGLIGVPRLWVEHAVGSCTYYMPYRQCLIALIICGMTAAANDSV
jgi:hypothetical protein